jgi:hypothetical protein
MVHDRLCVFVQVCLQTQERFGDAMAVELTGTVKYARHMKGEANGKQYDFFSFVVLDNDEGVRWPLQVQDDHPQFAELCQGEKQLIDQQVRVVIRSFSAGYRQEKDSGQKTPQARFYAKLVQVLQPAAAARSH